MWKDAYRQNSYLSLTLHYVTSDWQLKKRTIFAAHYDENDKSGRSISVMLSKKAAEFGIDQNMLKKIKFVSDRGSSLVKAIEILGCQRFSCVAHALNNVLTNGFNIQKHADIFEANDLIKNSKNIVTHAKRAGYKSASSLKNPVDTRFNTNYLLLKSIQTNYDALLLEEYLNISEQFFEDGEENKYYINKDLLDQVVGFLIVFEDAITNLECDVKPTLDLVPLWLMVDIPNALSHKPNDLETLQTLKTHCQEYFRESVEPVLRTEHKVATLLNPMFKKLSFIPDEARSGIISHTMDLMDVCEKQQADDSSGGPCAARWSNFMCPSVNEPSNDRELMLYIENGPPLNGLEILQWWKKYENMFPTLAQVARKLLAIPATNTSSERVFSVAGHTLNKRRTCLLPHKLDMLLFLHSNLENV